MKYFQTITAALLLIFGTSTFAQTCGFGCLGLSGFYGGYTYQNFEPTGLSNHLTDLAKQFAQTSEKIDFSSGKGFRIGANIFRAQFDNYFLTAKGYYQFIKEEKSISFVNSSSINQFKSTLELNHWGLGLDFGIPISSVFNWKIIEGGIAFYTTELVNEYQLIDNSNEEDKYDQGDINVGYYIGTGVIVHIIEDFFSIEGTAAYNNVTIDDLIDVNGNYLLGENSNSAILNKGNFSATIQLNFGVPL